MSRPINLIGYGVSVLLLAICAWYAFSSSMSPSILEGFRYENREWYVNYPAGFRWCMLLFAVLNVPAVVIYWAVNAAMDAIVTLSAAFRAGVMFVTLFISSSVWWLFLSRWSLKRAGKT